MAFPRQRGSRPDGLISYGSSFAGWPQLAITVGGAVVIFGVVFCCYWPAVNGGFLWDDNDFFINDRPEHLTTQLIHDNNGLYEIWFGAKAVDYWPLTNTAFWVQWRLWGMQPRGYHVTNIVLHAIGAILIWRVLTALRIPGAWLAALLFGVHPVTVASVAWISELKNVLSLPFYACSLLSWIRFEETGKRKWYGFALLAFSLALTAKASTVPLPILLLGLAWWWRGQIGFQDILRVIPFLLLSLAMGLLTISMQHAATVQEQFRPEGLASRVAALGWIVWFYLYSALAPFRLAMVYPRWDVDPASLMAWIPLTVLVAVFALLWQIRQTAWGRSLLAALGYFVVTLAPVSGILSMSFHRYSLVSDHLQYLALPAVAAVVAASLHTWDRQPIWRWVATVVAIAIVTGSCVMTWQRAVVFRSQKSLWLDTLQKNPNAWVAHINLGKLWQEDGRSPQAVSHYRRALRMKPDSAEAHNNLGVALQVLQHYDKSIVHYRQALLLEPRSHTIHNNLAWLYATCPTATFRDGRQALAHAQRALRLGRKNDPQILGTLAAAFAATGDFQKAVLWQKEALAIAPQVQQDAFQRRLDLYMAGKPYRDGSANPDNRDQATDSDNRYE